MFAVEIKKLIASIFIVAAPTIASAAGIEAAIQQIEAGRDESCRANAKAIQTLIEQISSSSDNDAISVGLSFLSREDFWRSADQRKSLGTLIAVGRRSIALENLAARALESANGELKYLVHRTNDQAKKIRILKQIVRNNEGKNRFYQASARISLAEMLQEDAMKRISGSIQIPLRDGQTTEIEAARGKLELAYSIYGEVGDFFATVSGSSDFLTRDLELDFRYQQALLDFVAGGGRWRDTLQEIVDSEAPKDAFSQEGLRHIYVHEFLRVPFTKAETTEVPVFNEKCSGAKSRIGTRISITSSKRIQKFFNPLQLSEFTCQLFEQKGPFKNSIELLEYLSRFENRDYRVVIGHFRGEKIRFSYLSPAELEEAGTNVANKIGTRIKFDEASSGSESCLTFPDSNAFERKLNLDRHESTTGRGFYFVGDFLSLNEANQVLQIVTNDDRLNEAYLIRPRIEE